MLAYSSSSSVFGLVRNPHVLLTLSSLRMISLSHPSNQPSIKFFPILKDQSVTRVVATSPLLNLTWALLKLHHQSPSIIPLVFRTVRTNFLIKYSYLTSILNSRTKIHLGQIAALSRINYVIERVCMVY